MMYVDADYWMLDLSPRTEDGGPQILPRRTVYGSAEAEAYGLTPIEAVDVIPKESEWQDVITECHAKQIFPMYHQEASGVFRDGWDQGGLGYCWAFGLTAAVMDARAAEGQRPVRLAPTSLGWLVGWRNRGFYLDGALKGAREQGIALDEDVPGLSINPNNFKPGWQERAKLYRPTEWWDTNRGAGDKQFISQCLAILATGRPLYIAYNWWMHALECIGLEWTPGELYNLTWVVRNSHGESGPIRFKGRRGVPDEAYGVRAVTRSE